jgi:WD40 repeat protein
MTHSRTFRVWFVASLAVAALGGLGVCGESDEPLRTIQAGDYAPSFRFELSTDGKTMVSGSFSSSPHVSKVWNTTEWRVTREPKHSGIFRALSPDGKTLAIVSLADAYLWRIDTETGTSKRTEITGSFGHLRTNAVLHAAYSPDGKLLATSGIDTAVDLWDAATVKKIGKLSRLDSRPSCIRFSADSTLVAAASWKGEVRVWDGRTLEQICSVRVGDEGRSLAFSPDGALFAAGGSNGAVTLFDLTRRQQRPALTPKDASNAALDEFTREHVKDRAAIASALCFSPDGKLFASGHVSGLIILWHIETGQELQKFEKHRSSISSIAFLPDGKTMITSDSVNGVIAVWDVSMFLQQQKQ